MERYDARFHRLDRKLAIVELRTKTGEWAGSFRVERGRSRARLYDLAYAVAEREAALKGGRLETFGEIRRLSWERWLLRRMTWRTFLALQDGKKNRLHAAFHRYATKW